MLKIENIKIRYCVYLLVVVIMVQAVILYKLVNEVKKELEIRTQLEENFSNRIKEDLEKLEQLQALVELEREQIEERDQDIEELSKELVTVKQEALKYKQEANRSRELTNSRVSSGMMSKSGATAESIDNALKNSNLKGLGKYYIQAEKDYGINAKFLASISILESGWGKSSLSNSKNNLFGFGAYDSNPNNAMYFNSKGESILYVGNYIAKNYLTKGGKYYNGTSIEAVNKKYCTSSDWSSKVRSLMNKM